MIWWVIAAFVVGFIVGLIVGVIWVNMAVNSVFARHFGW